MDGLLGNRRAVHLFRAAVRWTEFHSPGNRNTLGYASTNGSSMPKLITASQFPQPDAAYVALVEARRGLSEAEAADLDTRLVLILANHIGDADVLNDAIALAKTAGRK